MFKEQAQAYLILLRRRQHWIAVFTFCLIITACTIENDKRSYRLMCDSIAAHSEITSNVRNYDKISFQDDVSVLVLLKQIDPELGIMSNSYMWDIQNQSTDKVDDPPLKFPIGCDCEERAIDESPDGKWQIIATETTEVDGKTRSQQWLSSQDKQFELFDARNWAWSFDGNFFSYIWATDGPIGILSFINLETLDKVWSSPNGIQETDNVPDDFLEPWALSHNIAFSPSDKTYWYRDWHPESQNKIYVYNPIDKSGKIEQIDNIQSANWSDSFGQMMFVKSDEDYITITSEDGTISAKIPYELYLEIDGYGLESELTHTNFQVSPGGSYVVFPKKAQIYALGCTNE